MVGPPSTNETNAAREARSRRFSRASHLFSPAPGPYHGGGAVMRASEEWAYLIDKDEKLAINPALCRRRAGGGGDPPDQGPARGRGGPGAATALVSPGGDFRRLARGPGPGPPGVGPELVDLRL